MLWFNQLLEVRFSPLTEFLVVLVMVSTVYNLERQPDLLIEQGENCRGRCCYYNGTLLRSMSQDLDTTWAPPKLVFEDEGEGE